MKKNLFKLIIFFISITSLFILGCSDGQYVNKENKEENSLQVSGSCDIRSRFGYCYEYVGARWSEMEAKADCLTSPGGVFLYSSCPDKDIIGICNFSPGGNKVFEINYYFYEPLNPDTAKLNCPGKFTSKK